MSTAVVTTRVIMVVDVKGSDMDDLDAYVIEDTVVDYALVCFTTRAKVTKYIIESKVRHSEKLLNQTPTCLSNLGHEMGLIGF